jgi:hypothetical protein
MPGRIAMPTATIDGLPVNYLTRGSGPPLLMLMLAPGGFDSTLEKWSTAGVGRGIAREHGLAGVVKRAHEAA